MADDETTWAESYSDGSTEAEKQSFAAYASAICEIQRRMVTRSQKKGMRTFHAKILVGIRDAKLRVDHDIAKSFAVGYFQPAARFPVAVRFSNASVPPMICTVTASAPNVGLHVYPLNRCEVVQRLDEGRLSLALDNSGICPRACVVQPSFERRRRSSFGLTILWSRAY